MSGNLFPVFLKMERRRCLVVGAGGVAESKIEPVVNTGARVTVVAPAATPRITQEAAEGRIEWLRRAFEPADLEGVFLAIAATSDPAVNAAVFAEARRRNILCNSVDDPSHCDFYFPSVVRRGELQIAISTSGKSPVFARRLKEELNLALDESLGQKLEQIGRERARILQTHPPSASRTRLLNQLAYRVADELEIDTQARTGDPADPLQTSEPDDEDQE